MQVKTIAGHDLMPGKTVKDHIHVEGTELHVPHVLLCGDQPGPTVLISAGIHNAEYVGIQAAIELSNELDVSALHGNVIIVPLANRSGFENRTMSMVYEDGKNLNRVFPGDREGSEADKLAHMLFEVFIQNVDAYIDLHSGDGYETLVPFCYYLGDTPAEATARQMVDCINVKYVVRSRCRTGGAYNLASVHGIPSVLIERFPFSAGRRSRRTRRTCGTFSAASACWRGTGRPTPSRSSQSTAITRHARAVGTRRKNQETGSERARSWGRFGTTSAAVFLRNTRTRTAYCCTSARR